MHTEYDIIVMDTDGNRFYGGHVATQEAALEIIRLDRGLKRTPKMDKAVIPTSKFKFIQPMIVGLRFG